jgi:hypothetical protein
MTVKRKTAERRRVLMRSVIRKPPARFRETIGKEELGRDPRGALKFGWT